MKKLDVVGAPGLSSHSSFPYLMTLVFGHLAIDFYSAALPALLPFIRSAHQLTYSQSGSIMMVAEVTASIVSPVAAVLTDWRRQPWMIPVGAALGGVGLMALGLSPHVGLIMAAVVLVQIGRSIFHPEGTRTLYLLSGDLRATGSAYWYLGGNLGNMLGPVVVGYLAARYGLISTSALLPLGLGAALLVWLVGRTTERQLLSPGGVAGRKETGGQTQLAAFLTLLVAMVLRDTTYLTIITFYPFFYIDIQGGTSASAALMLTCMSLGGTFAALFSGRAADRIGRRRVLIACVLLAAPAALMLIMVDGWLRIPFMMLTGATLWAGFPITLVMAQEYLPRNVALAGAIAIGTGGVAGVFLPLIGRLADQFGTLPVLYVGAALPLLVTPLLLLLPDSAA